MSGPGGSFSSSRDTGNAGAAGGTDCALIVVDTTLNSPEPKVVNTLQKGDILKVEISRTAQNREIVVAKDKNGQIAGSLTPPRILDILKCMKEGHSYIAEVISTPKGGECKVKIRSGSV